MTEKKKGPSKSEQFGTVTDAKGARDKRTSKISKSNRDKRKSKRIYKSKRD